MKFKIAESLEIGNSVEFTKGELFIAQEEGDVPTYYDYDTESEEEIPEELLNGKWIIESIEEDEGEKIAFISVLSSNPEDTKYSVYVPLKMLMKSYPQKRGRFSKETEDELENMSRKILKRNGSIDDFESKNELEKLAQKERGKNRNQIGKNGREVNN